MKGFSIKTKLTLMNVGVLAVTLTALGLAILYTARANLLASVDREMQMRGDRTQTLIVRSFEDGSFARFSERERTQRTLNPPGGGSGSGGNDPLRNQFRPRLLDLTGISFTGERPFDQAAFKKAMATRKELFTTSTFEGESVRILTQPLIVKDKLERVLQQIKPLTETNRALSGMTTTMLIALPLILLVAAVGGAFLTDRAMRPVRAITRTAAEVGAESLDERLTVSGNDEFSRLSQTFNGMLDRLQGAFGRMEQAVEQQRRFTADASHELRTPLTVIKANTSLALRGERSPEEYKRTLAAVDSAADAMNRLVGDLLLLARSDSAQLQINLVPVQLRKVVQDAVASVSQPETAKIEVCMADEGVMVQGDAHSLTRLLNNLLENATRHTPADGKITIETSSEGDCLLMQVRDNGSGIAAEHLPHVLDRFYRVDKARARVQGGNGLGLSICASIVEAHKGTLTIASTEGEGTTVAIRIPLAS